VHLTMSLSLTLALDSRHEDSNALPSPVQWCMKKG